MRDRTDNILTECGALVEDVVQNLAEEGQGNAVPSDLEEDPEEDQEEELAEPAEEAKSVGSVTD